MRTTKHSRVRKSAPRRGRVDAVTRDRAIDALSEMRSEGVSLRRASQRFHVRPSDVQRYLPRALVKKPNGRYVATAWDNYARTVFIITPRGKEAITIRGSRAASRIAQYSDAVRVFLQTGKTTKLRKFRGQSIQAGKVQYPFLTSPTTLLRLSELGEIEYENLYARRG